LCTAEAQTFYSRMLSLSFTPPLYTELYPVVWDKYMRKLLWQFP